MSSAATQQIENFIKQYLISKNYITTLRAFEQDSKNDKSRGRVQPHKLVETLQNSVVQGDLQTLSAIWKNLEDCFFQNLDAERRRAAVHLKHALYKYYLIETIRNRRAEKTNEFFESEFANLQLENSSMWKEWLTLPYIKNPQEHRVFGLYFNRSWVDCLLLSLHNYLSLVLSASAAPALLQLAAMRKQLDAAETELQRLKNSIQTNSPLDTAPSKDVDEMPSFNEVKTHIERDDRQRHKRRVTIMGLQSERWIRRLDPVELLTDFYDLNMMEGPGKSSAAANPPTLNTASKSPNTSNGLLSTVRRHFNAPPLFKKKQNAIFEEEKETSRAQSPALIPDDSLTTEQVETSITRRSRTVGEADLHSKREAVFVQVMQTTRFPMAETTCDDLFPGQETSSDTMSVRSEDEISATLIQRRGPSLILDHVDTEPCVGDAKWRHKTILSQVKFSRRSPNLLASLDTCGQLNFWRVTHPMTLLSNSNDVESISTFDWLGRSNKMCLVGSRAGTVKLYSFEDKTSAQEATVNKHLRIHLLESFPSGERFICAARGLSQPADGSLSIWNSMTLTQEMNLQSNSGHNSGRQMTESPVNSCVLSPTEDVVFTGCGDGCVRVYDLRSSQSSWPTLTWRAYEQPAECLSMARLDPNTLLTVGSGLNGLRVWDVRMPQLSTPTCHDVLRDVRIGGPFEWAPSYKQMLYKPKGWLLKTKCPENFALFCDSNVAKVFDFASTSDPIHSVTLCTAHTSPVVCVDWVWGEDFIICATGTMDGSLNISYVLKSATD